MGNSKFYFEKIYYCNMKGIFIVFVVFSIGCSNYSHDADDKVAISIFISELDLQNLNNKSSELIEDYYYVKLETIDTMNLIGRIDKVVFYNKKIFILDRSISKAIFIFTEQGDYLSKIDQLGEGPGEFREPYDFIINSKSNQIIVYCKKNMKLICYDLNGEFNTESKIELSFRSFEMNQDNYCFFTHSIYNYLERYGEVPYDFIALDFSGNLLTKQFSNSMEIGKSVIVFTHNKYFTLKNNDIFLSWIFNDTIYKISKENKAVPFCYFDFGEHSIPEQVINNNDDIYIYKDVVMDGLYWSKYGPFEATDSLFMIQISAGISDETQNNFYFVLFAENLVSKIIFKEIEIENDDGVFSFPVTTYNDYFVSVVYPEEVIFIKENKGDKKLPILKGLEGKIRKFDNPVLMFTKFYKL